MTDHLRAADAALERLKTLHPKKIDLSLDRIARVLDALDETNQVGRGVDMRFQPRRLGDGAQEGDGGALAVGARHVDHRRQAVMRPA